MIKQISITQLSSLSQDVFLSKPWLDLYDSSKLCAYGIFDKSNQLIGGFCLYFGKRMGLRTVMSPPHIPTCSLVVKCNAQNNARKSSFYKSIFTELVQFFKQQKGIISVQFPVGFVDFQSFIWEDFKVIPNYTYRLSLEQDFDDIKKNFDPKLRNQIKKGYKDGLLVEETKNYDEVRTILMQSFDRNGANIEESVFNGILNQFTSEGNSFCYVVKDNNQQVLATTFCIYDEQTVYYILGGYSSVHTHSSAGPMALEMAIKKSQELNCKVFDFEGSMLQPVEKYFRQFGGELTPYFTVNKAPLLAELALKFKMRSKF